MLFRFTKNIFRFLIFLLIIFTVLVVFLFAEEKTSEITAPQEINESRYFPIEEDTQKVTKESNSNESEKIQSLSPVDCKNFKENEIASTMIKLINQDRKDANKEELSWNTNLCQSALLKSQDMIENNYFAHVSPDMITPWYWIEKAGYEFSISGENLALNYSDGQAAHEAFMASPDHRENVLNDSFTEIGINYAFGKIDGRPAFVLVEHFASPAIENPEPKITCDKETALENLEKLNEQLDLIEEYKEEAEEAKDKIEKNKKKIKEIDEYLDYLEDKKDEIEDLIDENEDYLEKCEKLENS